MVWRDGGGWSAAKYIFILPATRAGDFKHNTTEHLRPSRGKCQLVATRSPGRHASRGCALLGVSRRGVAARARRTSACAAWLRRAPSETQIGVCVAYDHPDEPRAQALCSGAAPGPQIACALCRVLCSLLGLGTCACTAAAGSLFSPFLSAHDRAQDVRRHTLTTSARHCATRRAAPQSRGRSRSRGARRTLPAAPAARRARGQPRARARARAPREARGGV